MAKKRNGNSSRLSFQDLYYDSKIDLKYDSFDEDSQMKIKNYTYRININDGWGIVKGEKGYIEFESDEWIMNTKNGKVDVESE